MTRESGSPPGMPRWVVVTLVAVGLLVLALVVAALAGVGGPHGPGRHGSLGSTPSAGVVDAA